jgi:hypothetical protein
MSENEMGNRGSKSGIMPVKEQRVDGSYFGWSPKLRCTLTGFFLINYQIKILSKQLNNRSFLL